MSNRTEAPRATRRAHWNNHLARHACPGPTTPRSGSRVETTTWRQLRDRVERLAGALAERGCRVG